jgi:hypothetical protein
MDLEAEFRDHWVFVPRFCRLKLVKLLWLMKLVPAVLEDD